MAKKDKGLLTGDPITYQTPNPAGGVQMETFIPWTLVKRGVKRQVITPIDAPEQFQMEATVERQERGSPGHAADYAHWGWRTTGSGCSTMARCKPSPISPRWKASTSRRCGGCCVLYCSPRPWLR